MANNNLDFFKSLTNLMTASNDMMGALKNITKDENLSQEQRTMLEEELKKQNVDKQLDKAQQKLNEAISKLYNWQQRNN